MEIFQLARELAGMIILIFFTVVGEKFSNKYVNICIAGEKTFFKYFQIPLSLLTIYVIVVGFGTYLFTIVSGLERIPYYNEIQLCYIVFLTFLSFVKFFFSVDGSSKTDKTARAINVIERIAMVIFIMILSYKSVI
jgi:hypothetical protein